MLHDYCCDYIERFNSYYDETVNKTIYSLCCDYIMAFDNISPKQRMQLINFFKLDIV